VHCALSFCLFFVCLSPPVSQPKKYMDFKVPPLLRLDDDNKTPGGKRGRSVISSLSSLYIFFLSNNNLPFVPFRSYYTVFQFFHTVLNRLTADLLGSWVNLCQQVPLSAGTSLQMKARICKWGEWKLQYRVWDVGWVKECEVLKIGLCYITWNKINGFMSLFL
jgi:hypothetical protein